MEEEKLFGALTTMSPVIYRDFYKLYYKERLKTFNAVAAVAAAALIIGGFAVYVKGLPVVWTVLMMWVGAFLLVYPRVAYKKPYKKARDIKQTTRFSFYETHVAEKTNSQETDYKYSDLMKILETNNYFFIFHTIESISIVDKENVKGGAEELAEFLKQKTTYKRIK